MMPWTYVQYTGILYNPDGVIIATGYSGNGEGKNNPNLESVHNVGPIPVGFYAIESPRDTETHGPFVLPLEPDPSNNMFGRSGFLMHGDNVHAPGTASEGCVIMPRYARDAVAASLPEKLQVVANLENNAEAVSDAATD